MTRDPSDFDLDIDPMPAVKTYTHQTSLPCYGRGKRLCELQIPEIPRSIASNRNKSGGQPSDVTLKPGRGRARSRRSAVGNEKDDRSSSPRGLQEVTNDTLTDSHSIHSEHSNRGPEHLQGALSQSYQEINTDESELQRPHRQSQESYQSPLKLKEVVTDVSPQTPSNQTTSMQMEYYSNDSPPLKVWDGWTIDPPNVIQFEGIPADYDVNVIHELLSSYDLIIDWESKTTDDYLSLRIKFSNAEVCESIEMNMDKSDFTGTGSHVRCKHLEH